MLRLDRFAFIREHVTRWDLIAIVLVVGVVAFLGEASRGLMQFPPEQLLKTLPVRRLGEPEDIANACCFLASEDSSYITGQTLSVNGGRVIT